MVGLFIVYRETILVFSKEEIRRTATLPTDFFLLFLKIIKDCLWKLDHSHFARKIFTLPLYGRLAKEEQEKVFEMSEKLR